MVFTAAVYADSEEPIETPNVLFVSYGNLDEAFDLVFKSSFTNTLREQRPEAVIYDEFLDIKRFNDPDTLAATKLMLNQKYSNIPMDLVVFDSLFAANMLDYRRTFSNSTIKIIQLQGNEVMQSLGPNTYTYSIAPDYPKLMQAVYELTGRSDIKVVVDSNEHNFLVNLAELNQLAKAEQLKFNITLVEVNSFSDIVESLRDADNNSAVFVTPFYTQSNKTFFSPSEVSNQLAKLIHQPLLVPLGSMVGSDVFGGYVISPKLVGEQVAHAGAELLSGRPMKINERDFYQYVVNYRAASLNKLSLPDLPNSTVVINKPPSLLGMFLTEVVAAAIIVLLLTLVIFVNTSRWRLLNKQKQELLDSQGQLKKLNQRIDIATSSANIGIWEYDVEQQRLDWDAIMYRLHGLDIMGISVNVDLWLSLIDKNDQLFIKRILTEQGAHSADFSFDYRCMDHVGNAYVHRIRGERILDPQGNIRKITGTVIDVSESVKNEKHLRQEHEKAEHARNAKTAFLANMSHEIRTPMNGVVGAADILSKAKLNREQAKYTNMIKSSAMGLLHILDDILDLSKIELGELKIRKNPSKLRTIVQQTMASFALEVKRKNIKLKIIYPESVPDTLLLDGQRVKQVLFNLVGNAVKFTDEGYVQITVDFIPNHAAQRECGELSIVVSDTGVGISEEAQSRIFDSFEQYDDTTVRKYGGSGLGLSISKKLASLMNGLLKLDSTSGKGSSFSLTLPDIAVMASSDISHSHRQMSPPDFSQKNILVVEDIEINREIVGQMLKDCNAQLDFAHNGEQAVDAYAQKHYDLILMDVLMPVMDGYEATKAIRTLEEQTNRPHCPVVSLTAHALNGDKEKCLSAGMDVYLTKPIDRNALYFTLNQQLNHRAETT
ncbi:ATP-binding protein [Glaciecola sp. SC05]|uniref:ATP-binding protein n=1 Tax=Glaciecola sp. SC05 TaxID=1987355 RepID=UPI0035292A80